VMATRGKLAVPHANPTVGEQPDLDTVRLITTARTAAPPTRTS